MTNFFSLDSLETDIKQKSRLDDVETPLHRAHLRQALVQPASKPRLSPWFFLRPVLFAGGGLVVSLFVFVSVKAALDYFADGTYSLSMALWNKGITYDDVVHTSSPPSWSRQYLDFGISLEIPFSLDWRIEERSVQPISVDEDYADPMGKVFRFGQYVNGGSYVVREYMLTVDPKERSIKDIAAVAQGSCFNIVPRVITIARHKAVLYQVGGAKGCSTAIAFPLFGKTLTLLKIYPLGKENPGELTPDMKRILVSLQQDVQKK